MADAIDGLFRFGLIVPSTASGLLALLRVICAEALAQARATEQTITFDD